MSAIRPKTNFSLFYYKTLAINDQPQHHLLPASELERFDKYEKMSDSEKEIALWETIRELAEGRAITLANNSKIVI